MLVHPVSAGRAETMHDLLTCTYGYAATMRRTQGASLDCVCLYVDAYMLIPSSHPTGAMAMWELVGVGMRRAFIILRSPAAPLGYL